jgi:hypothetical protein
MARTGEEFKQAAIKHNISHWDSHECSICGYMTAWIFDNNHELVEFDHGCNCTGGRTYSSRIWNDVANNYNIQSNEQVINEMDKFWGFNQTTEQERLSIRQVLESRLQFMEHCAKQGVIPGVLDSIELQQMIGRINELKFVLELIDSDIIRKEII